MRLKSIEEGCLTFDDGTTVRDRHDQDCCEHVYADFEHLRDLTIWQEDFDDIVVEGVPGSGVRINSYFVPCYNEQYGYYSGNLALVVARPGQKPRTIDVSEFVEEPNPFREARCSS